MYSLYLKGFLNTGCHCMLNPIKSENTYNYIHTNSNLILIQVIKLSKHLIIHEIKQIRMMLNF